MHKRFFSTQTNVYSAQCCIHDYDNNIHTIKCIDSSFTSRLFLNNMVLWNKERRKKWQNCRKTPFFSSSRNESFFATSRCCNISWGTFSINPLSCFLFISRTSPGDTADAEKGTVRIYNREFSTRKPWAPNLEMRSGVFFALFRALVSIHLFSSYFIGSVLFFFFEWYYYGKFITPYTIRVLSCWK